MSTPIATPSNPSPTAAAAPAEAGPGGLGRSLWMLGQLAEDGFEMSRAIKRRVTRALDDDGAAAADLAALSLAYARVSRAVRTAIMLQSKLLQDQQVLQKAGVQKQRIGRIVERIARTQHADDEIAELTAREAAERLDQDEVYGDVLSAPVSEIIARLCQDLGLKPDWPVLAEEAWARAEMDGGAVGRPLAPLVEPSAASEPVSPVILFEWRPSADPAAPALDAASP